MGKKKIKLDGKEYDLSDFNEGKSWSKVKKNKAPKDNSSSFMPNLLGKT